MPQSQIDVLIPVYNGAKTVRQAIASIQQQSVRNILIHVVDDGSTDETPAILAAIAAQDSRVVVHTQQNCGIVDALNAGLSHCTAEFIARHDADDLAYPDRLERQHAFLQTHSEIVAVGAAARHINESGKPIGTIARLPEHIASDPYWVPSTNIYLIHPLLMVRRQAIEAVGKYRHAHHAEDTDLYWRLLKVGRLYNMQDLLGDYRMHSESISGNSIVNGRIMALSSELAALSERRRRSSTTDYFFNKNDLQILKSAKTMQAMFDHIAGKLLPFEVAHFRIAVAAKLFDLASYRPYELDIDDCRFIRLSIGQDSRLLSAANRRRLNTFITGTAARLAHTGKVREAVALTPPSRYPSTLFRLAVRFGLPLPVRQRLRYWITGAPGK